MLLINAKYRKYDKNINKNILNVKIFLPIYAIDLKTILLL